MVMCFIIIHEFCYYHSSNNNQKKSEEIKSATASAVERIISPIEFLKRKSPVINFEKENSFASELQSKFIFPQIIFKQKETELSAKDFFENRNTPTQINYFDSKKFNTITAKLGTQLEFVPSTFKINDTTFYDGEVKIELKEVKKQTEMVFGKFSTTSNGEPIESAGMIYWNATTPDGEQLMMDSSSKVLLTISGSRKFEEGYQLFTGIQNANGMNWTLFPSPSPNNNLAVFPQSHLRFSDFKIINKYKFLPEETFVGWNDRMDQLNGSYIQNSSLCSYEFLQRLEIIRNMGWDLSLLDFYLENPGNINIADSLAVLQMISYSRNINKSGFKISKRHLCNGFSKRMWLKSCLRLFRSFYIESKNYQQPILINKKDLRSRRSLTLKLKDYNYANWLFNQPGYNYNYSKCSAGISDNEIIKRMMATSIANAKNYKSITLRLPSMGLFNCDRYINEPVRQNVIASVNNAKAMDNVYSFLLFRSYNSVMTGLYNDSSFIFHSIPKGQKVFLVIIGVKNEETYYSMEELKVNNDINTEATLTKTPKEEIECLITELAN